MKIIYFIFLAFINYSVMCIGSDLNQTSRIDKTFHTSDAQYTSKEINQFSNYLEIAIRRNGTYTLFYPIEGVASIQDALNLYHKTQKQKTHEFVSLEDKHNIVRYLVAFNSISGHIAIQARTQEQSSRPTTLLADIKAQTSYKKL